MKVLGLDPGSRRTGYGLVEARGNVYRCLAHGPIVPGARLGMPQRLEAIASRVDMLITEHEPDCVCIEEAFYHESVRSTLVLGHVRGALLVAAVQRGLAIAEYSPREVKLSGAGSGAAAKQQVAFMVRRLLEVKGALRADAADALAVALCHLNRERRHLPASRAVSAAADRLAALLAGPRARATTPAARRLEALMPRRAAR